MATGHLNGSDSVTSLSFSPTDKRTAVGQSDGTIDLMYNGAVDQTFSDTASPITTVAYDLRNLFATDGTKNFWHLNRNDIPYSFGGAGTVDAKIFTVAQDSSPTWAGAVTASYQTEPVPSGKFLGIFLNATAAVTAGGVVGDWYQVSDSFTYFELTDLIGGETEIFRAGNPNFPDGGLIVAIASKVIVFDIINGIPTMWKVRSLTGVSSLDYVDATLEIGTSGGRYQLNYVIDLTTLTTTAGTSTAATVDGVPAVPTTGPAIVNDTVNDVAATVLDGAPDATAGLKVPTWAVATDGGLSVGRDNGDIWDITGQANQLPITQFTQDDKVAYGGNANSQIYIYDIPTADINEAAFTRRYLPSASASDPGAPKILNSLGTSNTAFVAGTSLVVGFSEGLTIITEDLTDYFDGVYSWTTTTYNTGGMKQPDGAWACDNDPNPIGFAFDLNEDFDEPNVTVFEDTFNRTDPAPWTAVGGPSQSLLSIVSGELNIENATTTDARAQYFQENVKPNTWYTLKVDNVSDSGTLRVIARNTPTTGDYLNEAPGLGTFEQTFKTDASTDLYILLGTNSGTPGVIKKADNVCIEEVPALDGGEPFNGAQMSVVNGECVLYQATGPQNGFGWAVPFVNGTTYDITIDNVAGGSLQVVVGNALGSALSYASPNLATGSNTVSFTADVNSSYLTVITSTGASDITRIFDNVTVQQDPTGNNILPDYSGQGNDLTVIGQVTKTQFGDDSDIYGIVVGQKNYIEGTVSGTGQLIGWEDKWIFRRDISLFNDADDTAGNLVVKGLEAGSGEALLRYNGVAMTDQELNKEQIDGNLIQNGVKAPLETTYSLNDLRFAALRAQGYLGHTNDMLREWLRDNGAGEPLDQINDMWKRFLIAFGIPEPTYQYNDARYEFYGQLGYTGTLNDREVQFWRNGGVITFGGSGSFGTAFSAAFD